MKAKTTLNLVAENNSALFHLQHVNFEKILRIVGVRFNPYFEHDQRYFLKDHT